jgi:CRP-like cAMP-binding protein
MQRLQGRYAAGTHEKPAQRLPLGKSKLITDLPVTRSTRPRNLILSRLPEEQYQALARFLVPVDLPLNMQLSLPNQVVESLYFPVSGLISTDALTEKGESVEVGLVGREGFSGLCALFGQPQMSHAVVMQGAGAGFRIRASILREEFLKGGLFAQMVYDFAYLQLVQMTQSVLCNRMHDVEARLARWLLASADRTESNELMLTQEFLAQMLGSRRSTVTVAAGELQRLGAIDYSRGRIRLINRPLLESKACECYGIVRATYDRMLPKTF